MAGVGAARLEDGRSGEKPQAGVSPAIRPVEILRNARAAADGWADDLWAVEFLAASGP